MTATDPAQIPVAPPAGWYVDAHDAHRERWWDGGAWSDATRPHEPPAAYRGAPHNGTAYWSLALGAIGAGIGVAALSSGPDGVWLSTAGVFAVLSGVRALRLRRFGVATAFLPAVAGIVLGALGALLVAAALVLHLTAGATAPADDDPPSSTLPAATVQGALTL